MTRPAHHSRRLLLAVFVGGAAGTGARYGLESVPSGDWPWPTFAVNVSGAFLLGVLLEALLRRGPETGRGRLLRLGLGTGLLGGYTTYSALALEVQQLVEQGSAGLAVGYALASVSLGLLAGLLGVLAAAGGHRWRERALPDDPDDPGDDPDDPDDPDDGGHGPGAPGGPAEMGG